MCHRGRSHLSPRAFRCAPETWFDSSNLRSSCCPSPFSVLPLPCLYPILSLWVGTDEATNFPCEYVVRHLQAHLPQAHPRHRKPKRHKTNETRYAAPGVEPFRGAPTHIFESSVISPSRAVVRPASHYNSGGGGGGSNCGTREACCAKLQVMSGCLAWLEPRAYTAHIAMFLTMFPQSSHR